jgi:hypothetical protein
VIWCHRFNARSVYQSVPRLRRIVYTVTGSPVRTVSEPPDQVEHRAAHERILETLATPGKIESGNEMPVDLLED